MRSLLIVALLIPATAAAAPPATTALTDLRRFGDRIHVAHVGTAGLSAGALTDEGSTREVDLWDEQVVVERTATAVRIAIDDDDARLLLWIPMADAAWTVARPTRIVGRGATGVWMLPGAPLTVAGRGRRVAATFTTAQLTVRGTLARATLARVFKATTEPRAPAGAQSTTAPLRREPAGAVLLHDGNGLTVRVIDRGAGEWRLVETRQRYLRAVGWVRGGELSDDLLGFGGTGAGGGYGISDTQRVEVPAGACLFDPAGVAVVGIQTATAQRYAHDHGGGRWVVYVGNAWGLRLVEARDLDGGAGPPRWQMCR